MQLACTALPFLGLGGCDGDTSLGGHHVPLACTCHVLLHLHSTSEHRTDSDVVYCTTAAAGRHTWQITVLSTEYVIVVMTCTHMQL